MKIKTLTVVLSTSLLALANAQTPDWLKTDARLMDQALSAKDSGVSVTDATREILAIGTAADHTIQAITTVYASCNALTETVKEVVRINPAASYEAVNSVHDLQSCPCTADNVWPHTRLDSRIRVESRRLEPVNLGVASNCVAIAAKAAAEQAPEQADAILYAASGDPFGRPGVDRQGRRVIDAIGVVGEKRAQWQNEMEGKGLTVNRQGSDCAGDRDPGDEQPYAAGWSASAGISADALGQTSGECSRRAADLLLADYQNSDKDANALEVLNNTPVDIDLAKGGYFVDVYSDGATVPSKSIPLKGALRSGEALVLAGENADEATRKRAGMVLDALDVDAVSALVLRRGLVEEVGCDNVPAALGMIATALSKGDSDANTGTEGKSSGERYLDEKAEEYESQADARQIDAVGTVGKPYENWQGAKAGSPITVARENSQCVGDSNARDEFNGAPGWNLADGVDTDFNKSDLCAVQARDLVLAQYQNNQDQYRSVTLLNNTGAGINLEESGYVLEVYADGADRPTRTIALKGRMSTGSTYTLTDEDAPAAVKENAQLVTNEIKADKINALVLKRINVNSGRACAASVIAAARDIRLPLELVNQPFAPSREPQNGDSVFNRPIGAGTASPN
jgi:hypothetical protein